MFIGMRIADEPGEWRPLPKAVDKAAWTDLISRAVDTAKKAAVEIQQALVAGFNSLVMIGMAFRNAPPIVKALAKWTTRVGKLVPVVGAVLATVNIGIEWDNSKPWGNTRNEIGAGIAWVELAGTASVALAIVPGLEPLAVAGGVTASFASVAGIAWDLFDLVWDIGEEYFW